MDTPKTPPQPAPFLPTAPAVPVISTVAQHARGPEGTPVPPPPEPFRTPEPEYLSGTLSVPSGTAATLAKWHGAQRRGRCSRATLGRAGLRCDCIA
jgi:hypothetical protein